MAQPLRVLVVEDNAQDAELLLREMRRAGFDPYWMRVETEAEYLVRLEPSLDIILSDHELPQFSSTRALELLNERRFSIPFIIVSGTIGEDIAVDAIKHGATDYLLKDRLTRLGPAVRQALEQTRLREERESARGQLAESDERFRQVVENIGEVFWITAPDKNEMLYISPAYEKIWGRRCAELYTSPHTWLAAIHPEDRERVRLAATTKQAAGTYDEEYRIVKPDGSIRWIRDRAFPVRNAAGVIHRIVGVAGDFTERKRAEEILQESERRFRDLLENIDLLAMTLDQHGRVTFCNDALLRTTGWTREEVVGANWFSKFVPETHIQIEELFFQNFKTGQIPGHYETPIVTKDGVRRDILWNNTMLRDATGQMIGTASIGEDITDRKQAEERLQQQAAMLELAHEAIIVRDFYTEHIIFWNRGAERIYGWTAEEALEQPIGEFLCVDPKMPLHIAQALLDRGEWNGETHIISKIGKKLIISTRATLIRDAAGKPRAVLSINADVTDQRRLEAQYLRAQRMESIGTLASGVAHDLNNILAPIMMSVPLLRGNLPPESRESIISTIEMSAERGAQIVKQVLAFGRGVEGQRKPLALPPLILELEKIMRETFPKDLRIAVEIEPELRPILADSTQVHQILLNLCVNARDAMPGGGRLCVRASNLEVDANYAAMLTELPPGRYAHLEVIDNGTGIPPQTLERIFEPFFTTKGVGQGTGLGLATVLGIVKSHGGAVQVSSELGKGTTFHVYLPCSEAGSPPVAETALAQLPSGQGELILIVDDEASIRGAAQTVLQANGYQVICAADGTEALALSAKNAPRLAAVVTDLMMPFMDGVALVRALRKMQPGLPIAASTGLGEKTQFAELQSAGVTTLLHKPYGAEALLRAVHALVHHRPNPQTILTVPVP